MFAAREPVITVQLLLLLVLGGLVVFFMAREAGGGARRRPTGGTILPELGVSGDAAGGVDLSRRVCEEARRATDADFAHVWAFDERGALLAASAGREPVRARVNDAARPTDAAGFSALSRQLLAATGAHNVEAQPFSDDGRVAGLLVVGWCCRAPTLDPARRSVLALLASHLTMAGERVRLQRSARTDALTGLPNRTALEFELRRELARAERTGTPLALAIVDIDHFKALNDTRGHLAGDAALRSAAAAWRGYLRDSDVIARLGGDEFAVLLPSCPLGQAREALERMASETPEGLSCSVGVTAWAPGELADALVERADRALYAAKAAGRATTLALPATGLLGAGRRAPAPIQGVTAPGPRRLAAVPAATGPHHEAPALVVAQQAMPILGAAR